MLSVILLSRNTAALTRVAVDHLLRYTDVPFRLIVLDNGSTDGSARYLEALAKREPRLRLIVLGENLGFARGVNRCLRETGPDDVVALVNSDVAVCRNWASRLIAHLKARPRVAAVGPTSSRVAPAQRYHPRLGRMPADVDGWPPGEAFFTFADRLYRSRSGRFHTAKHISGMCKIIPPHARAEIGPLDEGFFFAFEDVDWDLRARLSGYELVVAEDVYVVHLQGASLQHPLNADARRNRAAAWNHFRAKWARLLATQSFYRLALDDVETDQHPRFRLAKNY